jgi:hypothetical protein
MFGGKKLLQAMSMVAIAAMSVTSQTGTLAAAESEPSGCVWCSNDCGTGGDLRGFCLEYCAHYGSGSSCGAGPCVGTNGYSYQYRISC